MAKNPRKNPQSPAPEASALEDFGTHVRRLAQWGALAWCAFVAMRYFSVNPLHGPIFCAILPSQTFFPTFPALFFYAKSLLAWAGIFAGCAAAGDYFLRRLNLQWTSALERLVFAAAAGSGLVALLILALGAIHAMHAAVFYALWLLGVGGFAAACVKDAAFKELWTGAGFEARAFFLQREAWPWRLLLAAFVALMAMMALVPDLFYDALFYHLAVPNLYLREHGIVRINGVTSRFPLLWQMLYTFGLSLSDEIIPKLIHFSSGVLVALGAASFAARFGLGLAGIFSAVLFLSVPMVQMNVWTSGIDIGSCLFSFLSLYALCAWAGSRKTDPEAPVDARGWVALSALLAGFAYGSKYQGGLVAIAIGAAWVVLQFAMKERVPAIAARTALFGGVLALAVSPWLLKNLWDTGNPVYPFLGDVFAKLGLQKLAMDPAQMEHLMAENKRFSVDHWYDLWRLPWVLVFQDRNQSSLSYTGPIFLSLIPVAAFAFRHWKESWFRGLFLFLLFYFPMAVASTHLTRYHLQGYPALCLFFGIGTAAFWTQFQSVFRGFLSAIVAFLALACLQVGLYVIQTAYRPWDVLAGRESRDEYRSYTHTGLNPYPSNAMYRWAEKNLAPGSRTLLIGDSKAYDFKLPHLYTDVFGKSQALEWSRGAANGEQVYQRFQDAGITHILVNFVEGYRTYSYKMLWFSPEEAAAYDDFWNRHVRPVHQMPIPEKLFQRSDPLLLFEVLSAEEAGRRGPPAFNPVLEILRLNRQPPES